MARSTWCLCLILTLLIAGSRRPVVARIVEHDPWWGTKEAKEIRESAERFRAARDFASAEAVGWRGYALSRQRHNDAASARYLTAIGVARFYQYQYGPALEIFLRARELANLSGDTVSQRAIAVNLSSLYLQTWDTASALTAAEQGIVRSSAADSDTIRIPLLMQLGRLHQMQGDGQAAELLKLAIVETRQRTGAEGFPPAVGLSQEARAWDLLGEERLRQGLAEVAQHDFDEAFRLRLMGAQGELGYSYGRLGAVRLALGDGASAARLTDLALRAEAGGKASFPRYLLLRQRGEIRRLGGDIAGALADLGEAIAQAELWRARLVPVESTLVASNAELESRVFRSFIETAAAESLRTGDTRLAAESFQAAELNRAASFRRSRELSSELRDKLPPEYWKSLAALRADKGSGHLKLVLTEMEAKAGLHLPTNNFENFQGRTSLKQLQRGLSTSELFLSFYVGEQESYLWAVTRNSLSIHRLPAANEIRSAVQRFRGQVRRGATSSQVAEDGNQSGQTAEQGIGARIYAEWLGGLSGEEAAKTEWLLSLDDALFQMPFAALTTEVRSRKMKYLVEQHSLQVVPGALSLIDDLTGARRGSRGEAEIQQVNPKGWFLGLGDPIYNTADPRWAGQAKLAPADLRASMGRANSHGWFAFGSTARKEEWSRLVGSADEVAASAQNWTAGGGRSVLLMGGEAGRDRFVKLAGDAPEVIHLATHISMQSGENSAAEILFGLDSSGKPETLTTAEIRMMRVPGAVVSMTGCASAAGDVKAGVGLLGLTRAWEIAGARAVVATGWPVGDTGGELFGAFYRNLRRARPAEAMRRSQIEMIASGSWRSLPSYWASYEVMGGAH